MKDNHHATPKQRISNPIDELQKRCDDQKKKILREYIIERGQSFGRIKFRSTWGHKLYDRLGGDDLFTDLPEEGSVSFSGSGLYPGGNRVPK